MQENKNSQSQSQAEMKNFDNEKIKKLEERIETIEKSLAICLKAQSQLVQDVSFVAEAVRQIFAVLLGDTYDNIVENYAKNMTEEQEDEEEKTEETDNKKKKKYKYQ